jgi:hypothetical protein
MSNNIYDILKKIESLEAPKKTLNESKSMDKKKEDKKDESKKKDKADKGAIAEAVATVESQLNEKYMGFKKTVAAIKKGGSAENPEAVAASIGRKKYGKEKFQKAAAAGKKLGEGEVEESGLQAYLGKKKYGEQGMKALQKAGREGASKEKMAQIRARHDKMDEGEYNEDMLSPAQKKFAALAEPKDKITYADKIAGAKKGKKDEGNEFSGELVKARAQGKDSFEVDGKSYPVKEGDKSMREGWEEMQKYLEKKRGPESKGGEGKKAGTRYGGSAQKDDDEEVDGEGKPQEKKRGRPKGTGGGAKFNFKKPKG